MSRTRARTRDPKYQQVFSALKHQIQTSEVGKLSEAAIMEEFGIGRNTALKALDMLETEGMVRRVKGSGTFPVRDATGSLKQVNIVFTDGLLGNLRTGGMPSFLLFSRLQGIFTWRRIGQCFVKIIFVRLEEPLAAKKEKILSLGPRSGLVIPAYRGFEDIIDICREQHVPYITTSPAGMDFNTVAVDDYAGCVKAVTHLIEHSHRTNILFLAQGLESPYIRPRYDAYVDTLNQHRIQVREDLVLLVDPDDASLPERLRAVLRGRPEIDAIFTTSARFFPAIAETTRALKIKVPSQKAVVSFDDPPELDRHRPRITAVRTPLEKAGELMVEKVVEMIDFGFRDDYRIVLDPELVIRESS